MDRHTQLDAMSRLKQQGQKIYVNLIIYLYTTSSK